MDQVLDTPSNSIPYFVNCDISLSGGTQESPGTGLSGCFWELLWVAQGVHPGSPLGSQVSQAGLF